MLTSYIRFFAATMCVIFLMMAGICSAQTLPDTLTLKGVEVVATRIDKPLRLQPTEVNVIDSTRLSLQASQNLGQVLNNSTTLFIKDNGPGGLATVSQRGLSAGETQVLWEGIPINNIMLGLTDFSLLPASMFSSVQVNSGNPSTAFGGGGLGGAIYLSSDASGQNHLSFREGSGSYGQWQSSLNGGYHTKNWHAGVRSAVSQADNGFEYYNPVYNRHEYRRHNHQQQQNVLASAGYHSGVKDLEIKFWISDSNNEIPGSILNTNPKARQDDQALRWLSSYHTRWHGAHITLKNYLDRVELNYFDPSNRTRSLSTFRRWLTSAGLDYRMSNHVLIKGEMSTRLSGVETNNYSGLKTRQQFSALVNPEISLFDYRLRLYPALRFDSYNDFGNVLSPSVGLNYQLIDDELFLRGQWSRDFNPPTFNNLYFQPNNDPTLHPERSNNAEAGLVFNPRQATFSTLKLQGFYNRMHDGIRYFEDEAGIYMPQNVNEITSKGVKAVLKNKWSLAGNGQLQLKQAARFTNAEVTEPRFPGDASMGHQLSYVPRWNYQASLSLNEGIFTGLMQYRWTGRRYITATENIGQSLDPYQLLNVTIQLKKQLLRLQFTARGSVRNLLNTRYEIIRYYALPLRNFHFSLTATYKF